jgi:uncharacterized protein YraI
MGEGWRPGDTITIYLENPSGAEKEPLVLTTAIVTNEGRFVVTFTYPVDKSWFSQPGFLVTARAGDQRASAVLTVISLNQTTTLATIEATPAAIDVAIVSVSLLTLRSGPDISYSVLSFLAEGTTLTVLGQNEAGDWLFVRLPAGTEGWVYRVFVTYTGQASIVTAPAPPASTPIVITEWRG